MPSGTQRLSGNSGKALSFRTEVVFRCVAKASCACKRSSALSSCSGVRCRAISHSRSSASYTFWFSSSCALRALYSTTNCEAWFSSAPRSWAAASRNMASCCWYSCSAAISCARKCWSQRPAAICFCCSACMRMNSRCRCVWKSSASRPCCSCSSSDRLYSSFCLLISCGVATPVVKLPGCAGITTRSPATKASDPGGTVENRIQPAAGDAPMAPAVAANEGCAACIGDPGWSMGDPGAAASGEL
mmetsp:Transcript_90251/g.252276  ORF Transcript_90251/g.252276 Transcript_90251/m.252276 type:complete len:245 (+) Transcript_90251:195-929(+)